MKGIRAVVTYHCNFMCSSCRYKCAPFKRGIMNPLHLRIEVLKAIEEGFNDYLIIEGGEVFLNAEVIYKYLKKLKDVNIKKYVVTNGYWGNFDIYNRILYDLRKLNLSGVIIEYDYFHSFFVDIKTVKEAAKKVLNNNLDLIIRANICTKDLSSPEDIKTIEDIKLIKDGVHCKVIFEGIKDFGIKEILNKRWQKDEKIILYKQR
ncbi:4Fe-4S single cluster domain-containing protein [Caloramator fervidus]|uniref:4Fe-4S single cluster domain-containing protein n=1 Tax=Caloramator fervidus TaxID=29344 RepID=A0A1H5VEN7_9CLOT|nr:4Fe-4S cluster-binding domain-containing protein [Caloramator fervidus]SEF84957.1 4Fe-4S single cluster domain-containing protein [Caloramator fervidus]